MKEIIEHQGVIASVEGSHVQVNIVQVAACGSCKARSLCTSSESKEKIIDVYEPDADSKYRIGEHVKVCGTLSMGRQAVWWAFGLPLLLMVVWMMTALLALGLGELVSTMVLAAILFFYFYILYLNKDRMARRFAFWIA